MNRWVLIGSVLAGAIVIGRALEEDRCQDAWMRYRLSVGSCPSGKVRQTGELAVSELRRGTPTIVRLGAKAHYTVRDADAVQTVDVPHIESATLTLVDAAGKSTPLAVDGWKASGGTSYAHITVPDVPDGDYKIHASYATRLGTGELDVRVPLYTPARIHVITDRPLYEPGNLVKFRAVALRARDLAPLDGRPGRWVVKDPNGEILLEEKANAADWGVAAGSFPLDKAAPTGTWTVSWISADAHDDIPFTVQPFKLPRFRVDAQASKPFFRPGETPAIRGAVTYASGAPVAKANLDITWNIAGSWPPPLAWQETLLPKHAVTAANGRFELALPVIPADLQGQVSMTAQLSAVDAAGDRVEGSSTVLLAQDGIVATVVTELGDGLVNGFNNRMYVRVTTPDGRVVSKSKVTVKRAWQANDPGLHAELDEDGVASLQIDPGAPVNIVIPPAPFRAVARPPLVTRDEPKELVAGEGATLADQVEMDRWLVPLAPCAKWFGDDTDGTKVALRVASSGAILAVGAGTTALDHCVADVVKTRHFPAGKERLYTVSFGFGDPDLAKLDANVESALDTPAGLAEIVAERAKATRDCLPVTAEGALPKAMMWRSRAGSREVELSGWIADPTGGGAPTAMSCVASRFGTQLTLAEKAAADSLGLIRFSVEAPARLQQAKPQATTMLGYELTVTADLPGEGNPSTTLRIAPGEIPALRMRVSPVLAKPGDTVTAELIRGPSYGTAALPTELVMSHRKGNVIAKLDAEHKATFQIPADREGWFEIAGGGTRALVYVKPPSDLAVSVEPKQPTYKPGDMAELQIQTRIGGHGGQAAVGLFGVDDSLGQLVALPGADSMGRVQPQVTTSNPAFGFLDGQALALGRVRGANAAAATVLRVSSIPQPPELDAVVNASAQSQFDPTEELTDHFYVVLAELHTQARAWEATAPAGEKMRPATMAGLWNAALAACEKRGEPVTDAYGRTLSLSRLPPDLLSLTDPRAVIVMGTRLPEDVENWAAWVAQEKSR